MSPLELTGLTGDNPLGMLAALGILDVLERRSHGTVRLRWTEELVPHAVISGADNVEDVLEQVDQDRLCWLASRVLHWPPPAPLTDVKPDPQTLTSWQAELAEHVTPQHRDASDLWSALLAEGAFAGKGDAKPTHLHFTAGQQRFLTMVREIATQLTSDDVREALLGPWRWTSPLPSMGWDGSRGERVYAVRGTNPATEKRLGVPGADWLGFLGLTFLPVALRGTKLLTTGCTESWKKGTFTWPLWKVPLSAPVTRSLLSRPDLDQLSDEAAGRLGLLGIRRSPIRRTDQGGYGSFGPSTLLVDAPTS